MKCLALFIRFSFIVIAATPCCAILSSAAAQDATSVNPPKSNTPESNQVSDTTLSPDVKRQHREQAYVKLLAGQRMLVSLRSEELASAVIVERAKQAQIVFEEAAQLDPSLAETYTALAEIALFYYPRNMDEAIRLAKKATQIENNNFGGHQILARIYALKCGLNGQQLNEKFAELAIMELREVSRLAPNDAEAWALLGELYLARGDSDNAIQALTHWAAAPPAVNSVFYQTITGKRDLTPDAAAARLGEALMRAGRRQEAVAAIRRALFLSPQNEDYEDLLSRVVDSAGDDDEAVIAELRSTIASDPESTASPILLARVLTRAGRLDEALKTLRAAIGRHTDSDKMSTLSLRLALAQTFADAERFDDGVTVLEGVLQEQGITGSELLSDQSKKQIASELLRRIVGLYRNAGKSKEALAAIDRMRRLLGNDDPTIDFEEIGLLRALGKRREALSVIHAARLRYPQQSDFVFQESVVLTQLGRVDEGVALLRARLSPRQADAPTRALLSDVDLYLRIASLFIEANRGTDAVNAARQALELVPEDQPDLILASLITLSSAQENAGDKKGSEESLQRVLSSEPDNATALNNLGYLLVEHNERLDEALKMIQRAVKAEPYNSSFLDSLGWAYFKLGQFEEAERNLTEAARRDSDSATIQEHLGDLYFGQGNKRKARVQWQKSLRLLINGEQAARIRMKLERNAK